MKKITLLLIIFSMITSFQVLKAQSTAEKEAQREREIEHKKNVKDRQNNAAYMKALDALEKNKFVLESMTVYRDSGIPVNVTEHTNYIVVDGNQAKLNIPFSGFNPGIHGLAGLVFSGKVSEVSKNVDKKGNMHYYFTVSGEYRLGEIHIELGAGSAYATATLTASANGKKLIFSGLIIPLNESKITKDGFDF